MDNLKFDEQIERQISTHIDSIDDITKELRDRTYGECDPDDLLMWFVFDKDDESSQVEFNRQITINTISHFRKQIQQIEHHLQQIETHLLIK